MKEKIFETEEQFQTNFNIHRPAVSADLHPRNLASYFEQEGGLTPVNIANFEKDSCYGIDDTDFVFCLKGETWPDEASEWQVRERISKWPTKELQHEIINSGYFLVGVGSNESEIQWRMSFNKAELLLIESFNETQTHCIMFLKLLKSSRISKPPDPIGGIHLLVSTYQMYENTPLSTLNIISEEMFIEEWLRIRVGMAQQFHVTSVHSFLNLYDGHSISNIYLRCTEELEKLKSVSYAQPYIKLLLNCIVVQQHILLTNGKKASGRIESSDTKNEYLRGMISSVTDLTHTSLRIATCLLDDGVKGECLKIIRALTANQDNHLFMQNYSQTNS
ncbi:Hypothetical predicted protein [Mytilus galloprovincialis]|uniref:Mab-21-like nucleotidyltransferase domain-containing protein n=1 Tax=Mytilus galloprovincialis TaxID=29158 RepID=A0A8B6FRF0_MYTGA|nr:Hypothetical predicted protein [Mytilus galloprovincialis]